MPTAATALIAILLLPAQTGTVRVAEAAGRWCGPVPATFDPGRVYAAGQDRRLCISHIAEQA